MYAKLKNQEINAEAARRNGFRFYEATEVYLCPEVAPRYLKLAMRARK